MDNDAPSLSDPTRGRAAATAERGVVWLRSGASAPAGLLNALAARGLRVTVVVDAAAVVREMIRGGVACLVLHEGQRLERVGETLDTLDRYFPDVLAMHFGRDEQLDARLRMLTDGAGDGLATDQVATPQQDELSDAQALTPRVTVSEAELTMLLGPMDSGAHPAEGAGT